VQFDMRKEMFLDDWVDDSGLLLFLSMHILLLCGKLDLVWNPKNQLEGC
jgi:hypothetical protein